MFTVYVPRPLPRLCLLKWKEKPKLKHMVSTGTKNVDGQVILHVKYTLYMCMQYMIGNNLVCEVVKMVCHTTK